MMMLIQWLCPARHCVLASVYQQGEEEFAAACAALEKLAAERGIAKRCGICDSRDLRWEEKATRYQTLEEMWPVLLAEAHKNRAAQMALRKRGMFFSEERRN